MHKINRAFAKSIDLKDIQEEIHQLSEAIKSILAPVEMYLFGSAVCGPFFEDSDFDVVIVFKSDLEARNAWRQFSKVRRKLTRSLDLIPMSFDEFHIKKELGGIAMIAFTEGRRL